MARSGYAPDDLSNTEWPNAFASDPVCVPACSVDLFGSGNKQFGKRWLFQIAGADELREVLNLLCCVCDMPHQKCEGSATRSSAFYTYKLASLLLRGACCK